MIMFLNEARFIAHYKALYEFHNKFTGPHEKCGCLSCLIFRDNCNGITLSEFKYMEELLDEGTPQ